jgi:hypothetical protein
MFRKKVNKSISKVDKIVTWLIIWWALASIFWVSQTSLWRKWYNIFKKFFWFSYHLFWKSVVKVIILFKRKK